MDDYFGADDAQLKYSARTFVVDLATIKMRWTIRQAVLTAERERESERGREGGRERERERERE